IIAIASLVAALGLSKLIGTEFVPVPDKGEIRIQFETPVDASLEYTQAKLHQVDQIIRQFPDVVSTYGVVNSTIDSGKNHAGLGVTLKPKQQR
ncbi:efflux RND transporter permease subunit, partial [Acinetobacter baumannii]